MCHLLFFGMRTGDVKFANPNIMVADCTEPGFHNNESIQPFSDPMTRDA